MAKIQIDQPVGVRNGRTMMPNKMQDLDKITALFDQIPVAQGGTREVGGVWMTNRDFLIAEVTKQIVLFQTINKRPQIDGVIDPKGGTLKLMNQLAVGTAPLAITAEVVPTPAKYSQEVSGWAFQSVDIASMPGTAPLKASVGAATFVRRLVRVEGTSVKWFGVVFPRTEGGVAFGRVPHIFFTPGPWQGGYHDAYYETFGGSPPWTKLWHDYSWGMGRQIVATGADQILVIPLYKSAQHANLGEFLGNWREAVTAAVTAAIDSLDVFYLRDRFTFDRICSSSFSNGWVPHNAFNTKAAGASGMTDWIFDLDGQAAHPPSHWRPANGVIYLNRPAPNRLNPVGNLWYVGGRWGGFTKYWGGYVDGHQACASYMLFHGVWQYCT